MTSPRKMVSQFTSSTTNRGVEAKEIEIANVQLGSESEPGARSADSPRGAASYIHVIVEKHRGGQGGGDEPAGHAAPLCGGSPLLPAASVQSKAVQTLADLNPVITHVQKTALEWRKEDECNIDRSWIEDGPASVEVWQFEGGGWLSGAGGGARLERWWARRGRRWRRACRELGAAGALAAAGPLALAEAAGRAAAGAARAALAAAAGAASDALLKPALALVFNSAVRPPLVFARETLAATRAALAPLWLALGDALAPLAALLRAARLVDVHVTYCRAHPPPPPDC